MIRPSSPRSGKKYLNIITCDKHVNSEPAGEPIEITGASKVYLKAELNNQELQFFYAINSAENLKSSKVDWQKIGPVLDGSILSDDYVQQNPLGYQPCFTGAFYALACQDLSGQSKHADFEYFEYKES